MATRICHVDARTAEGITKLEQYIADSKSKHERIVFIMVRSDCRFCNEFKRDRLSKWTAPMRVIVVTVQDVALRTKFYDDMQGSRTVPNVWVNGTFIDRGSDTTEEDVKAVPL